MYNVPMVQADPDPYYDVPMVQADPKHRQKYGYLSVQLLYSAFCSCPVEMYLHF